MSETLLITGGCGFIGSNFIKYLINTTETFIINLDSLTYAGNLSNLQELEGNSRYTFVKGSICDSKVLDKIVDKFKISGIINFAAESHVDRSILNSEPFVETNISGTIRLLELCKKHDLNRFVQISTDEVYGSLGNEGKFTENTPLDPNSSYSASKASADHFVRAYVNTFGINASITRCSNNYGPFQFPEKLIPLMIINALNEKKLPVYGDGKNVRDWIHVEDHCRAIWKVYQEGKKGQVYNIGAEHEEENINIVKMIIKILDKSESLIQYVVDRPGHDRRYAIDPTKMKTELNWSPKYNFEEGLRSTINWYVDNKDWWEKIISGEYKNYYKENYGGRL